MSITMDNIEKRLKVVEDNTTKILFYMESDPTTKKKGFIESLKDTEERVRLLELQKKLENIRNGTIAGGVSFVFIVVAFFIEAWVNNKFR